MVGGGIELEIDEILMRVLGEIEPWGETNIDTLRFKNVENYKVALEFIINKLSRASKFKDRREYSIQKIGKECFDILIEFGLEEE